jgi:hypothetical protein
MADEAQPPGAPEEPVTGAIQSFHIGDLRQFVSEVAARIQLRVPTARGATVPAAAPAAEEARPETRTGRASSESRRAD